MLSLDFGNLLSPSAFIDAASMVAKLENMEAPQYGGASITFIHADDPEDSPADELGNSFCPCDGDDWNMWKRNAIAELSQDANGSLGEHFRYMLTSAYLELAN